ncbi:MAG: TolC family protein [Bacteroidales bacterium]
MNQLFFSKMQVLQNNKFIILLIYILLSINSALSQDVYDLKRCIENGLERNFGLQVVRNQEQIAKNNYTPGNAGKLPAVNGRTMYGGSLLSTQKNLRDGTETYDQGIHNQHGTAGVELGMDIFRGFQVRNTYKKLGEQSELGKLNTQLAVERLVSQIVAEYSNYIQQLILYKNLAYAVSLSRERVRIDEQRYLLGSASKLELLQSLVYLNADSSRYARQNEVLRTSQIKLNTLMSSASLGEDIVLQDSIIVIEENLLFDDLLEKTIQHNTILQIASKNLLVSELDLSIVKSRSYPYLTMSSAYDINFNGYETGSLLNQRTHGFNYGINLGVNIFDGFNRKREITNAHIEIENKMISYKETEQDIKADLLTIFYAYENNLRLLRLEEQNLEVARENLEIALERYKLGSLAGLELREVQKSLLDAEERLISVKYLTKLAEISLKQISGSIMDYYDT